MIEKLRKNYKDDFTTNIAAPHDAFIYFTSDAGEVFGIRRTRLSSAELNLLTSLFEEQTWSSEPLITMGTREQEWHSYLLEGGELPSFNSDTVRFYYYQTKQPAEDIYLVEEAIKATLLHALIIWKNPCSAIIIEEHPEPVFDHSTLIQLIETITSDFYIEPAIQAGQLHKYDPSLHFKVKSETEIFRKTVPVLQQKRLLTFYEALPVYAFIEPLQLNKKHFFSELVSESLNDQELITSIKVYLESNLNVSMAAKKLYMHRNSLQYRIEKFIEKTGIDLKHYPQSVIAYLFIHYIPGHNPEN
ncbi:helix-turn-helix domain-containing protein [Metabacillus lacus]|nr:helix-turn-helix domain-containing protein [Metabacillus lacus]